MLKDCIKEFELNYRVWACCTRADNQCPGARQTPINRLRFLVEIGKFWATQAWRRLTWPRSARV